MLPLVTGAGLIPLSVALGEPFSSAPPSAGEPGGTVEGMVPAATAALTSAAAVSSSSRAERASTLL